MKSFLTGLAAGIAIGYLTAPRTGKETRDQLKTTADEQTRGLKDQWHKTVSQAKDLLETVKSQVGMGQSEPNLFADMESGKMDQYKDDASYQKQALKADYTDHVDELADSTNSGVNRAEDALTIK
jgi:gas vesicle protein